MCLLFPRRSLPRSTVSMSKRQVVHSEGRAIIAKVFHFYQEEYKFLKASNSDKCDLSPLASLLKRTAEATGVSESTVSRILKEEKELASPSSKFTSPMTKRRKRLSKFMLDDTKTEIIRTTIENFQIKHKKIPTLAKLKSILREKIGFDGCLSTLRSLLKKLGYECKKSHKNRISLKERHEMQ
ncbi:uncharacterized protein [Maniola hyperantus]|uniref:uncharacterized protein n=1 Tax=Aphantopus hyperantus TaxID=2795564 RepID=UPI00213F75CA